MRVNRIASFVVPLLLLAAGSAHAAVIVTLSAVPSTLTAGQTASLVALVTGATNAGIQWTFTPATTTGATTGPAAGPDSTGKSTNSFKAPSAVTASFKITVTATSVQDPSQSDTATITVNPTVDVGTGAPESLQVDFIVAFFRNQFNLLVSMPPIANVKRLGTTGYVQEFNDVQKTSGVKLALASVSPNAPISNDGTTTRVVQLLADLYGYYATVGAAVAGLPLYDTQQCPPVDAGNSCTWDTFDKNYALFAYRAPLTASASGTAQNLTVRDVANSTSILFYTTWSKAGGLTGLGPPVDVETAVTGLIVAPATTATTATVQAFSKGAIYSITSGVNRNTLFTVTQPIYGLYLTNNGPGGSLGLPITPEIVLPNGDHRQTFEGGVLQYTPGGGGPVIRPPVTRVLLSGAAAGSTLTLNLGQSVNLTATPMSSAGEELKDRPVTWSTTNSRVATVTSGTNGAAVIKAVGGGAASITAASEGVASQKLNLIVIAPCCEVGDGSPPAVQQSFKDALTRNKISVATPLPSPAARVGGGYVQTVQSAGGSAIYVVAQSDKAGTAYVIGGAVLAAWQASGGAGGPLGYPVSDLSAGGTQRFDSGTALAGNPVRLVSGGILTKWGVLGYEAGTAGAPVSDSTSFSTFGANSGATQGFAGGAIYQATAGPRSPQAYFVTGLILLRYNALGGPGGDYGMPTSEEFITGGVHQQNFEGGNFTWSAGDGAAKEHAGPKTPGLIVSPSTLTAGSRARFAVVGFPSNSTIQISVAGQPDFTVTSSNGAYSWDMFVPLSTKSGSVAVRAVDTKSTASASGTLTVRGFNDNRVSAVKAQGDNQTGLPGALLPLSLRVALRDSAGDPVVGAAVTFEASSGAQLSTASTVTDANGLAESYVRLQSAEGITLVTAAAPSIATAAVTFGLRSAAASLSNFPKFQQTGKGALVTAAAAILRYHQTRGELGSPNGPADPAALGQFLANYCPTDTKGVQLCDGYLSAGAGGEQVVNLWRAAEFAGGADIEVAAPAVATIADFLADGSPALLSLAITRNGTAAGGHFVVATGIDDKGAVIIQDPNPALARTGLSDYLNGFTAGGVAWKATVRGVARFALENPGSTRFLLSAVSQPAPLMQSLSTDVSSAAGACGQPFEAFDSVDASGNPASDLLISRFLACDGAQSAYELQVGAGQPYKLRLTDLAAGGSAIDISGSSAATWKATRQQFYLTVGPEAANFTTAGVVNAATFAAGIAPGGMMSIFGTGLSGSGKTTTVDMDGTPLRLAFTTPFQINAEVPLSLAPGVHSLRVQSVYGSSQQQVTVSAVAPGIFLIGNPPLGAITNANNSLVAPTNPLPRGQALVIYATGLGAVTQAGQVSRTNEPVTVMLNGTELQTFFAGLTPGYFGLYQVNVTIPAGTAPGLSVPLTLKVGGQLSNSVQVALQ